MDDELELEVSDLRTGRAVEAALARERRGEAKQQGGAAAVTPEDTATAPEVEVPVAERMRPAGARLTPRVAVSRRVRGYLVAGVVLLICTAILVTLPGAQQSIRRALADPTPTPTATLAPDASVVYLADAVPWGALTVDGSTPSEADGTLARLGYGNMLLHLARGRHTLAYSAEPFPAVKCALSVPAAPGDTCPQATSYTLSGDPGKSRVIDLGATLQSVPSDQVAALDAAAAALGQTTYAATVAPGDHYLGPDGTPAVATAPLAATLSFTLNTDPSRAGGPRTQFGAACVTLCTGWDAQAAATSWQLLAHAVSHWQFTAADGQIDRSTGGAGELDIALLLDISWQGRWTITSVQLDQAVDFCGAVVIEVLGAYLGAYNNDNYSTAQISGTPMSGCVVEMPQTTQPATVTPGQQPPVQKLGALLYHYGVLVAVDDAAHRAKPELPVASADERALAQQWLSPQGG